MYNDAVQLNDPAVRQHPGPCHKGVLSVKPQSITKTFYVYILARPDGRPFYIGKGAGQRIFVHAQEARRGHVCHKCNTIRKIWKQGGVIQQYIVLETDDEQEAFAYERDLIALHGRDMLCNLTDGGEGSSGVVTTEEVRAGRRVVTKALWNDPDYRARMSQAMAERWADPEARTRMTDGIKGAWAKPEVRRKQIDAMTTALADPGVRARISAASKAQMENPAARENLRAANMRAMADPVLRAKIGAAKKKWWDDPQRREAQRSATKALWSDPDYRARMSAASKARWSDPEYRVKVVGTRKARRDAGD